MFKIDRNILGERHDALYNLASKEMKELYDAPLGNNNLLVLKRSKKEIKEGDIFLVSIEPGVYFYGKVFEAKIVNKESDWVNGNYLIFIFKCKTHNKDLNDYKPNYDEIITGPRIVTDYYWKKGWFETIDDVPKQAYTMGIRTIMQARKVLVVVSGADKAEIVKKEH